MLAVWPLACWTLSSTSAVDPRDALSSVRSVGSLPVEGHLPGFDGATGWLNSPPLAGADLQGKVVLADLNGAAAAGSLLAAVGCQSSIRAFA